MVLPFIRLPLNYPFSSVNKKGKKDGYREILAGETNSKKIDP
jgi:hypothetical protein